MIPANPARQRAQAQLCLELLESRDLPAAAVGLSAAPHILATPNDPSFRSTYGLTTIKAPQAWDVIKGSTRVVVASIDTGVDYTHPDLYLNIWINQAEIPSAIKSRLVDIDRDGLITFRDLNNSTNKGTGKIADWNANGRIDGGDLLDNRSGWENRADNGANGFVDDLIGWNWVSNTNDPKDDSGHGTHTAGTIGAIGNNGVGVAGVAWVVQIMPLKFFSARGGGTISGAASAIRYAANNGTRASNNSWGYYGGYAGDPVYAAIAYAASKNHLVVAAAGNDASSNDTSGARSFPAAFTLSNIISVAATTSTNSRASFSNYGKVSVDLGAPGSSILSTVPGGYAYYSGTSMAAPHVTGAIALLLSKKSNLTAAQTKAALLNNTDWMSPLNNLSVSNGKLNVHKAISYVSAVTVPTSTIIPTRAVAASTATLPGLRQTDVGAAVRATSVDFVSLFRPIHTVGLVGVPVVPTEFWATL